MYFSGAIPSLLYMLA